MSRELTRGQTQVLYRFLPGAIFDHDDYGLCKVEEITLKDPETPLNTEALFDAVQDAVLSWPESLRTLYPDLRTSQGKGRIKVGVTSEVRFNPYPETIQCSRCNYATTYSKLPRSSGGGPVNACPLPKCTGKMKQLRYVEAHNCGRIEQLRLPSCQHCGQQKARLFDPGRTALARWTCLNCGYEMGKLHMTPCTCAYTKVVKEESSKSHDPRTYLRVYPTGEPGLFIPQVLTFINFEQHQEQALSRADQGEALMLARVWGLLNEKVLDVVKARQQNSSGEQQNQVSELIEVIRATNPDHPTVKDYDAKKSNPPGQQAINRVLQLLSNWSLSLAPRRRLIEHVALRDTTQRITVEDAARYQRQHSPAAAEEFECLSKSALQQLGISWVEAIKDFPIAQVAYGYTRVTRDPARSVLNPFPPQEIKTPMYVLPTETEGLWFQLRPLQVVRWLINNNLISGEPPQDDLNAWAFLQRDVLGEDFRRLQELTAAAAAVQTLMHTISHIMLRRIEWSGYASASVGEYLLPETLSFILYANRFTESKIGGLTTLFEQRLPQWLVEAAQSGRECIYDPLCQHDGGSCVGCLHRDYNCPHFNHHLSRGVLFGGNVAHSEEGALAGHRFTHGFWAEWQTPTDR